MSLTLDQKSPALDRCEQCKDEAFTIRALRSVLADRERELLELKGPCSNKSCVYHYAHSGPCDTKPQPAT